MEILNKCLHFPLTQEKLQLRIIAFIILGIISTTKNGALGKANTCKKQHVSCLRG